MRWPCILFLFATPAAFMAAGCTASSIETVLIHEDARDVRRHFVGDRWRQISYWVRLDYPATGITDSDLRRLEELGWKKCVGDRIHEGWDSYVDASDGKVASRTVFQNVSYWWNAPALLAIILRYEDSVDENGGKLDVPDSNEQFVFILEDTNPGTRKWLGVRCE